MSRNPKTFLKEAALLRGELDKQRRRAELSEARAMFLEKREQEAAERRRDQRRARRQGGAR
jgi:hypothetical protein